MQEILASKQPFYSIGTAQCQLLLLKCYREAINKPLSLKQTALLHKEVKYRASRFVVLC